MSDILRRIITRFEAQGGNVRAVLGGVSQGYGQAAGSARTLAREQTYLNSQLRAFGTTIRYAIAGGAVFGAAGTISTLSQIQTQLGLISAIGSASSPQGQGLLLVGDRLDHIANRARQAAISTVQPVTAIDDAIISLLSTVRNPPEQQIVPMVEEISKAATLSQISVDEATKSFLAMQTAFGRPINLQNVRKSAQEFFMLISRVPGGPAAGGQILQQFGQLAAVSRAANITQPQLFGLLTAGLRTGIPPAQFGRGLQFLIQTLGNPSNQTKESREALAGLGITPEFIAQNGGVAALGRIIDAVRQRGGISRPRDLARRLSTLEEQIGEEADIPSSLISGQGAAFAGTIFRRVHAFRTFVALFSRTQARGGIDDPTLAQEIRDMLDAENGHVRDVENLAEAWKRFQTRARLPQAAVALQALGQDIITTFEPILNLGARGITGLAGLANRHEDLTHGLVLAGGLALLARGGLGLIRGGLSRGAAGLALAQGVQGADGPWKGMPGESVTHPAYVWVLGTGLKFGAGNTPVPVGGPGGGGAPGETGRGGRFSRFFRSGAGRALGAAGLAIAADEIAGMLPHWRKTAEEKARQDRRLFELGKGRGGVNYFYDPRKDDIFGAYRGAKLSGMSEKAVAKDLGITVAALDAMIERRQRGVVLKGQADVNVNVESKQPDGSTTKKKVGVTVDLFPQFNDPLLRAPSSKGKGRIQRRG